jgi:hypothetical protein
MKGHITMTQATIESPRFTGARQPVWRSVGITPLHDHDDILEEAGLDFAYRTLPLTYDTPDGITHTSGYAAVAREPYAGDPEWKTMGPVGPTYTYLQNQELLDGIRVMQKEAGWALDSLGTLGRGDTVFFVLRADGRSILGDRLETFIILHEAKARRQALSIAVTPLRLWCMNQLQGGGLDIIRIPHHRDIGLEYSFWTRMLGKLQSQERQVYQQLEAMAGVHIDDAMARTIIERAYPMPRLSNRATNLLRVSEITSLSPQALAEVRKNLNQTQANSEEARELVASRRQAAYTLYERFNDKAEHGSQGGSAVSQETLDSLVRTPYGVLQAITELVDWGGQAGLTIAAGSALFGEGSMVKARAWKAALAAST